MTIKYLFIIIVYYYSYYCLTLFTTAFASDTVAHVCPYVLPFLLLCLSLFSFFYKIMENKDEYITAFIAVTRQGGKRPYSQHTNTEYWLLVMAI